ncbi:MAG: polyhydroxyalkanoate synthesis repressor PhaR, partial [Janthinobacterium lividum]
AEMVRAGRDFVVYDAKTSDDITRSVLTQIIVEEESKGGAMLPTPFLRQLIGLYGGNLQGLVPRYLEQSMGAFAEQQSRLRTAVTHTMGTFMPPGFEEIGRQNMAMIERALNLFTPFYRDGAPGAEPGAAPDPTRPAGPAAPPQGAERAEIDALRAEVETLRRQLASARETPD